MTRINANIPPAKLIDQHLLAEYKEMVRIPNAVKKYVKSGKQLPTIPENFRLGKGHVLYFYNKLKFLHNRFIAIKKELNKRGTVTNMSDAVFYNIPSEYYNDIDTDHLNEANSIVIERIRERIWHMNDFPRYNKKEICKTQAINLLTN